MRIYCRQCGKKLKENTAGDTRYCQGHSIFDHQLAEESNKDYKESSLERLYKN